MLHSANLSQTLTPLSGQMCARKDRHLRPCEPASFALSLSISVSFILSFLIPSFLLHLSLLANMSRCYPPKWSSAVWRAANMDATIISSPLHISGFGLFPFDPHSLTVCLCVWSRCAAISVAKSYLGEPFPPSVSFLWLASPSDEQVSKGRGWV